MKVKICGLTRQRDAELAVELGADALGFVHERLSPRYIGDDVPAWIARLSPFVPKVAVFGRVDRPALKSVFDLVQGAEWDVFPEAAAKRLHVLRLRPGAKAADLIQQTIDAGALVLDAHSDAAYGGTGKTVDWDLAAEIVQRAERPIILAGGLTPDNVADAVRRVRPYAVDVSSGVEETIGTGSAGIKDPARLRDFIAAARGA